MTATGHHCPQCESAIIGRTDKKFCSDQCRFLFNNARKRGDQAERLMQRVNAALRKNRSVLHRASPIGKTTLPRKVLELAGLDFRYHTNTYRTEKGNTYFFCYDYGYLLLPGEKVLIVNWQPYMEKG